MSIEILMQCQEKIHAFYRALDLTKIDELIEIFHVEGQWVRKGEILMGHEKIENALKKRDRERVSFHSVTNLIVQKNNDQYHAEFFVIVYDNSSMQLNPSSILLAKDIWIEENGQLLLKSKSSRKYL